jgi:hypothetical protein
MFNIMYRISMLLYVRVALSVTVLCSSLFRAFQKFCAGILFNNFVMVPFPTLLLLSHFFYIQHLQFFYPHSFCCLSVYLSVSLKTGP